MNKKFSDIKFNLMIFLLLIIGIIFIYSTYAWFSSTLDVEIHNFNVKVDTENGLYISLDGINWGSSVDISEDSIINNLNGIYNSNTNRWSDSLVPVSTVGLLSFRDSKFSVFEDKRLLLGEKDKLNNNLIVSRRVYEDESVRDSNYVAFDLFLKNVSDSPYSDNLYIINGDEVFTSLSDDDQIIINAARLGIVFIGSVNKKSSIATIQNIGCSPMCEQLIFEPSITHTDETIEYLKKFNISIGENEFFPTYALVNESDRVNIWSGVHNSNVEFDDWLFSYQDTVSDLDKSIYKLPDGITKMRIYIWIEGQDIDIIRYSSKGYKLKIGINFEKDLTGYN